MLMQATMFLAQPKRARLLVLQELTTRAPAHPVHQPAQMPMLDITFHPPANQARPLVLLERLVVRLVRLRALMRCQVILYQFRVKQAQQSA